MKKVSKISFKLKCSSIAALLRQKILNRSMVPGAPFPSAGEIAQKYNVCMMTANKALNILAQESLIVRHRGVGNFVSRNMKKKSISIGFADNLDISTDFYHSLLVDIFYENAVSALQTAPCTFRLISYEELKTGDPGLLKGLDSLLISASYIDDSTEKFLRNLKIPMVIYRSEYELDWRCTQVIPDHSNAINELFALCKSENFDGIIIFHHSHPNGRSRGSAFESTAVKYGFPNSQIKVITVEKMDVQFHAEQLLNSLKNKLVISCSDLLTLKLAHCFTKAGFTCGKDYQLVSYDNLNDLLPFPPGFPEITTIDYSRAKLAQRAVKEAVEAALDPSADFYQIIKFPTRLMRRMSALSIKKDNYEKQI